MIYHYKEDDNLPKAIGISSLVIVALGFIAFFIVFGQPQLPEYGMGGLIVNYGTSEEGMGDDFMSIEEPSIAENANNAIPDKVIPEETPTPTPTHQVSDKAVATQDMEDAPAVTKTEKPVTNASTTTTKEEKAAAPVVNQKALFSGKKNNGTGRGDGTGTQAGNQGKVLGDPTASNYDGDGSGFGNEPITLSSRFWSVSPKIEDKGQFAGKVNVQVWVDKNGNVTNVRAGVKGSTYSSEEVNQMLERAFRGAKLNVLANSPSSQTFVVPINFKLR